MVEFPREKVLQQLAEANLSAESVTGLSSYLRLWKDQADQICGMMAERFCVPNASSSNRLGIFYVFNDLVQKEAGHFSEVGYVLFLKVVGGLIALAPDRDNYVRTVAIWKNRGIYSPERCDKIREMFRTKPIADVVTPPTTAQSAAYISTAMNAERLMSELTVPKSVCGIEVAEAHMASPNSKERRSDIAVRKMEEECDTLSALMLDTAVILEHNQARIKSIEQLRLQE
eukprot:GHVO01044930.1.p1 GENE.GHVO01044930.1~~GHVO01044930.1.p1  ORF type:complete len:229 (+),score=41.99 GHVO01044930.1:41-727(+)